MKWPLYRSSDLWIFLKHSSIAWRELVSCSSCFFNIEQVAIARKYADAIVDFNGYNLWSTGQMPQKKKKPSAPIALPTKSSFFEAKREYREITAAKTAPVAQPRQRLLYDKETGMPYAEVIDNAAVCLDTGQELFRFKERGDQQTVVNGFDFTPPSGKKHPYERSVDVRALVAAGILSNEDVARRRGFSDDELSQMMQRLSEYHAEREAICAFRME